MEADTTRALANRGEFALRDAALLYDAYAVEAFRDRDQVKAEACRAFADRIRGLIVEAPATDDPSRTARGA